MARSPGRTEASGPRTFRAAGLHVTSAPVARVYAPASARRARRRGHHSSWVYVAPEAVHRQPGCSRPAARPLTGRRPQRVCSSRCRVARWRQTCDHATAAKLAQFRAENATLRQRVRDSSARALPEFIEVAPKAATTHRRLQRRFVLLGGLVHYGHNSVALARSAAVHVDKILRGAKPADLPIEQPTKFEFIINLKTAKALGLTIRRRCWRGRMVIE